MKYGVTASTMATEKRPATFGDGNIVSHLRGIKELGFDGIDVFIKPMPESSLEAFEEGLADAGLEVSVIFPIVVFESGLSLSDPVVEGRQKAVASYKTQIELAARLKSGIVLGLERGNITGEETIKAYQERLASSLAELANHAAGCGVAISMEPIHRFLVNTFHRVEECLDFFAKFRLDTVGLLLDTFHMNIEERSLEDAVATASGRITHVHAVENNRGVPGDGHVDFESFIYALRKARYDGYLSLETRPETRPFETALRGIENLKGIVDAGAGGTNR